jgi:hypothetical protein
MSHFEKMFGQPESLKPVETSEDRDYRERFIEEYKKRIRKEITPKEFVDIMVEQGKLTPEEASKIIVELDQRKIRFQPHE